MRRRALHRLGTLLTRTAFRRFVRAAQGGVQAQNQVWTECHRLISKSSFWKLRFSTLPLRLEDFGLTEFSDYESALREAFQTSKVSPLNGEPLLYWAQSSGTTGKAKYFPITRSHIKQVARTSAAMFHRRMLDFSNFMGFRTLVPSDPSANTFSPMNIATGSISTFGYLRTPKAVRPLISIPVEIMANADWFAQWASLYALASDTASVFAMTPYSVCRIFQSAEANRDLYLAVLEGRAEVPVPLSLTVKRRAYLIAEFKREELFINRLWPHLKFLSVWKSSICATQMPKLESLFEPGTLKGRLIDSVYAATEGWMNVPFASSGRELGGPNHLGAHLFEYLPLDVPVDAAHLLKPWQLKIGENYELVLTNAMGLVRYRMKDVVQVLGYFHQSPIISFQYKSQNLLRLASVTLDEIEIAESITEVMSSHRLKENFQGVFTLEPSGGDRILVFYSSAMKWSDEEKQNIAQALDQALIQKSFEYAYDRKSNAIRPLLMIEAPEDHEVLKGVRFEGIRAQAKSNYVLPVFPENARSLYQASIG